MDCVRARQAAGVAKAGLAVRIGHEVGRDGIHTGHNEVDCDACSRHGVGGDGRGDGMDGADGVGGEGGVNTQDASGGAKVASGNAVSTKYAVMPLAPVTLLVSTATDLANTNCPVYELDACNVPAVITNDVTVPFNALVSPNSGVESTVLPSTSSSSSITQSPGATAGAVPLERKTLAGIDRLAGVVVGDLRCVRVRVPDKFSDDSCNPWFAPRMLNRYTPSL